MSFEFPSFEVEEPDAGFIRAVSCLQSGSDTAPYAVIFPFNMSSGQIGVPNQGTKDEMFQALYRPQDFDRKSHKQKLANVYDQFENGADKFLGKMGIWLVEQAAVYPVYVIDATCHLELSDAERQRMPKKITHKMFFPVVAVVKNNGRKFTWNPLDEAQTRLRDEQDRLYKQYMALTHQENNVDPETVRCLQLAAVAAGAISMIDATVDYLLEITASYREVRE